MQTALKLPPSGRDFQVYQRVIVDAASTRQAASEFSLSQTRVRQVVQRVSDWLAKELPAASEEAEKVKLWLAKHVAADRLQALYGDSMSGWRTTHEPKYLGMAIRVISAQSRLPATPGTIEALAADASEGPLPETDEESARPQEPAVTPPIGDCSRPAANGSPRPDSRLQPCAATPVSTTSSVELPDEARAARRAFFGPAQQRIAPADDDAVTELTIAPHQPGFRAERVLTRRQRRRLARSEA